MFTRRYVLLDPNSQTAPAVAGPAGPGPASTTEGTPLGLPHTIGTPETAPVVEQPQPTAEEQRFAALEQTNQQILAQNQQLMHMMLSQRAPQGPAAPIVQAPAPFSLEGLPDAVAAPKDFVTQLGQRIQQRETQQAEYITRNITQQVARGAAMDGVFNRFQSQHSALAGKKALMQGAALTEFQALQAQGIDPVSVAMQDPDSLVTRIAARMNQELGIAPAAPGTAPQHGAPLLPTSPATPNAARVAGLQGGSHMPAPPRAAPAPKSFIEQLNDVRKASGLV